MPAEDSKKRKREWIAIRRGGRGGVCSVDHMKPIDQPSNSRGRATICARGFNLAVPLAFLVCMAGLGRADLFIQPYLQAPSQTGVSILWWTDDSHVDNRVEMGTSELSGYVSASELLVPGMGKFLHHATLDGLWPGTVYKYRVRSGDHVSDTYTFQTSPLRTEAFKIAFLGDGRTDNDSVVSRHRGILSAAESRGADLIFEVGDMVYDGSSTHWARLFRQVLTTASETHPGSGTASRVPYHMAVGNHEIYERGRGYAGGNLDTAMARYRSLAHNPRNSSANPNWEERYYVLHYGVVTLIVLDANNTSDDNHDNHRLLLDGDTPDWEPGSEQYLWLLRELAAANQRSAFTFVLFHPAPYSRGVHGDPLEKQSGYPLRILDPIFREYGVDAVICSHDHLVEHALTGPPGFERDMDVQDPDNLNWLTMGNSGHSSRGAADKWTTWMDILGNNRAPFYSTYFYGWAGDSDLASYVDLAISPLGGNLWQADFAIVRSDRRAFDTFSLTRPLPSAIVLSVTSTSGGKVSPSGEIVAATPRDKTFLIAAIPDPGFVFDHWEALGDCELANERSRTNRLVVRDEAVAKAGFLVDSDSDSMADDWEMAHGLDITRDDSLEDLDGDYCLNGEEYASGSDPTEPTLRLRKGWNMVSARWEVAPSRLNGLFAGFPVSHPMWTWQNGVWVPAEALSVQTGCWVHCDAETLEIAHPPPVGSSRATALRTGDPSELNLEHGWALYSPPYRLDVKTVFPGIAVWGWGTVGFEKGPLTMQPKSAYWLHSADPATIHIRP